MKGVQVFGRAKYTQALRYQDLNDSKSDWGNAYEVSGGLNFVYGRAGRLWMVRAMCQTSRFNILSTDLLCVTTLMVALIS